MRLRIQMFISMLRQEMGWYDRKENGVGALCARLSGEAAQVQGVRKFSHYSFSFYITCFVNLGYWSKNRNSPTISINNRHRGWPFNVLRMETRTGSSILHTIHTCGHIYATAFNVH